MDYTQIKILLVEDSEIVQKIALRILEEIGCSVDEADTGSEALTMASHHPYDLIFMDIGLPDMDGLMVTESIRKLGYTVPIVALTAHVNEEAQEKALKTGMNDFFVKPLTQELAKKIIDMYVN